MRVEQRPMNCELACRRRFPARGEDNEASPTLGLLIDAPSWINEDKRGNIVSFMYLLWQIELEVQPF